MPGLKSTLGMYFSGWLWQHFELGIVTIINFPNFVNKETVTGQVSDKAEGCIGQNLGL